MNKFDKIMYISGGIFLILTSLMFLISALLEIWDFAIFNGFMTTWFLILHLYDTERLRKEGVEKFE